MSSKHRMIIDAPESADQFKSIVDLASDKRQGAVSLAAYLRSLAGGARSANILAQVGAVQAVATLTVSSTGSANDEAGTLLNQAITGKTSGADTTAGEFNISATPATQAASMALMINSTAVLSAQLIATSALGVVTITARTPGALGNGLELALGTLANVALGAFASGADGTSYELDLE